MRLGQKEQLLPTVAQALTGDAARADGNQRSRHLIAVVIAELPRVQKGQDAAQTPRCSNDGVVQDGGGRQHRQQQIANLGARDKQQHHGDAADDHRRTQIGLL